MALIDILKTYAFDKMQDNGLLLLPMPTGSGKTYTIFKLIHDALVEGRKEKMIFVTSLKKNIDLEELKQYFESDDELKLFNDKVLFIKSFVDCVVDNLQSITDIDNRIKYSEEYKNLLQQVKFVNKNKKNVDYVIKENVEDSLKKIRDVYEPKFRRKIKNILKSEFKTNSLSSYDKKLQFIQKKWNWLLDVYPQILTKKRQVYLMSMDKFLFKNDPIIERSTFIYKDLAKNAIVFIDEFDSTKDRILDHLIEVSLKNQIDYLEAYKQIYHNLKQADLPSDMTIASEAQKKTPYKAKGLKDRLTKCQKICEDIYNKYCMRLDFKLEENDATELYKTFLFHDFKHITISDKTDDEKICFYEDSTKRQNIIRIDKGNDDILKDFRYMINEIKGFLKFFCGTIQILAVNYLQYKHENGKEDYNYEDAVLSFLDVFIDDDRIRNYFVDEIMLYLRNEEDRKSNFFDASFFERGFSYYSIEDDDGHSFSSSIRITELSSTPEKILLDICKKAKVFGISATANIPTCIGNFALDDYLIPKLKGSYYTFSDAEFSVLKKHFETSISHYDRVNINVKDISSPNYGETLWNSIFTSESDVEEVYNDINQNCINVFYKKRLYKTAVAIKQFIENKDIKSMICFLNMFPDDGEFSKAIIEKIFNKLSKQNKANLLFNTNVVILRYDYESTKEKLKQQLKKGTKVLVLSTYQTIGAGQNLQYEIPTNVSVECINENDKKKCKDFDAVYLESPTNLYTTLNKDKKEGLVDYITQLEYLKENGVLSLSQVNFYIRDAFKEFFYNEKSNNTLSFTQFKDYKLFVRQRIMQAVGRICRTNWKSKNIYIYYDDELTNKIDSYIEENDLLNPEFKELLNRINKNKNNTTDNEQKFINQAETKSAEALNRIIRYVKDGRAGWSENAITEWQSIRKFVLSHPTMSEKEFLQTETLYQPFYIKLPTKSNKVFFKQTGDFQDVSIAFKDSPDMQCVSAENARLDVFLNIEFINEMFKREDFATDFEPNEYIICPPVFTNIYKGALGEFVGREIFKQLFDIQLEEIQDNNLFELFDFKVPETDIYVDFKHWNEFSKFVPKDADIKPHIIDKLEKCGGNKALVINLLAEEYHPIQTNKGDLIEIPRLYDTKNQRFDNKIKDIILKYINK